MATIVPDEKLPLVAHFADDQAAVAGAVMADATLIGLAGAGIIAVTGGPGIVGRLRAAGAFGVTALPGAVGCGTGLLPKERFPG